MKSLKALTSILVAGFIAASTASAINYGSFAPLSDFTAGGTPSVPAAITTDGTLTIALKAQQRYSNPALSNDGAGTYFAETGQNNGLGGSSFQGALWNFNFFIGAANYQTYSQYAFTLYYGLKGGTMYSFDPKTDFDAFIASLTTGFYQDSQNLLFSNFGGASNQFNTFDPNANATYDFLLEAQNLSSGATISSGITVQVGTGSPVPDVGSTVGLLFLAVAGMIGARRRLAA